MDIHNFIRFFPHSAKIVNVPFSPPSRNPILLAGFQIKMIPRNTLPSLERFAVEIHRPARTRELNPTYPSRPIIRITTFQLDVPQHD
jgi:hypothetical protein